MLLLRSRHYKVNTEAQLGGSLSCSLKVYSDFFLPRCDNCKRLSPRRPLMSNICLVVISFIVLVFEFRMVCMIENSMCKWFLYCDLDKLLMSVELDTISTNTHFQLFVKYSFYFRLSNCSYLLVSYLF